ncbi:FMN-binding protein [Rugosimonospora africana]|nr:FMN-binding protein [Rugosimonospora africana]
MRRAVAIVLGTATGTALLVGAKLGNAPSGAVALDGDAGGVVVSASSAAIAQPSVRGSSPSGMATAGTPTSVPTVSKPSTPNSKPTTSRPAPPPPSGPKSGTYSGSAPVKNGRYGTLSMSVTISGGKIASISASENGGETNCYHNACNTLKPEALQAQSANIASVSGATYSSEAFKTTLQAALNSAKA